VNVPLPDRRSPFHSANPFAGMPASSVIHCVVKRLG
jgi:hypothetical protein